MTPAVGRPDRTRRCAFRWTGLAVLMLALTVSGPVDAAAPSVDDITRELICQCGCTLLLSACQGIMSCSVADEAKAEIALMLRRGQGRDAIISVFVARYGERVLAAPTRRGFNLVAWITPFAAALGGAAILVVLLLGWTGSRRRHPVPEPAGSEAARREYLDRLERELRKFEW